MCPQMKQLVETLRCCSHQAFAVTPDVKRAFETVEPFDLHGELRSWGCLQMQEWRLSGRGPDELLTSVYFPR